MSAWNNPLPGVPLIESPFFDEWLAQAGLDDETLSIATDLRRDGYAVFDFPSPSFERLADRARADIVGITENGAVADPATGIRPVVKDLQHGHRVQHAWVASPAVRELACNARILQLLRTLYGRRPWPFQTINFSSGTQQHPHSDSVHFSSVPERFMCGVWIAFEDTDADNGPLVYYPGSHRWPLYANEHIEHWSDAATSRTQATHYELWERLVAKHGLQPRHFHARRGQALLWSANLLHGGERQRDPSRSRWSQVTHYYFENCAYYTPMFSDPAYGRIQFREPIDVSTGKPVKHYYVGREIPEDVIVRARTLAQERPRGNLEQQLKVFDEQLYLLANPDVKAAGVDARRHYVTHGFKAGRPLRPKAGPRDREAPAP